MRATGHTHRLVIDLVIYVYIFFSTLPAYLTSSVSSFVFFFLSALLLYSYSTIPSSCATSLRSSSLDTYIFNRLYYYLGTNENNIYIYIYLKEYLLLLIVIISLIRSYSYHEENKPRFNWFMMRSSS